MVLKSTNSNVTQQSSIIQYTERRAQSKIDCPENNAINHLSSAPIDIQLDKGFQLQILSKYSELFDGKIGLMKSEVSITLKDDTRPYQIPIISASQAIEKPLKDELDQLVCKGILFKIDPNEPSNWLNSFACETQW